MKLSLLVLTSGKQEGKVLEVKLPQFLVGRDPQCHLRPASPLISKRHCALIQKDGKVFLRDFGSTNGSYVNEERVEGERELHNDDQLKIGPISFVVRIEATAVAPGKTPAPPTKPVTRAQAPALKTPAKLTPSKSDTPVPATAAKASKGEDDDIMAMLMSLDGDSPAGATGGSSDGVPEGSTVMDLKLPPEVAAMNAKPGEGNKPPAKPAPSGDTRSAAAKILEKMTKRPRS